MRYSSRFQYIFLFEITDLFGFVLFLFVFFLFLHEWFVTTVAKESVWHNLHCGLRSSDTSTRLSRERGSAVNHEVSPTYLRHRIIN